MNKNKNRMPILQATRPLRIRQNRITWNRKPCEGYKPWVHHTNTILHLRFACKVVGKNRSNALQMVVKMVMNPMVKSFKNHIEQTKVTVIGFDLADSTPQQNLPSTQAKCTRLWTTCLHQKQSNLCMKSMTVPIPAMGLVYLATWMVAFGW